MKRFVLILPLLQHCLVANDSSDWVPVYQLTSRYVRRKGAALEDPTAAELGEQETANSSRWTEAL
jgi:hypothetical protein